MDNVKKGRPRASAEPQAGTFRYFERALERCRRAVADLEENGTPLSEEDLDDMARLVSAREERLESLRVATEALSPLGDAYRAAVSAINWEYLDEGYDEMWDALVRICLEMPPDATAALVADGSLVGSFAEHVLLRAAEKESAEILASARPASAAARQSL